MFQKPALQNNEKPEFHRNFLKIPLIFNALTQSKQLIE